MPHVVDPLGGSYYVEALTQSLANEAWKLIEEVEALGGMTKAVESGHAEAAHRRERGAPAGRDRPGRRDDRRRQQVPDERVDRVDVRDIDNTEVRRQQIARLETLRANRDTARVEAALDALTKGAGGRRQPARARGRGVARATVGEISDALESVFTRHRAVIRSIAGVYGGAYDGSDELQRVRSAVEAFAKAEGRRPRILVAKLGQDGHDRGAKVIATAFADLGFDVDIGPLFQTPDEAARDRRSRTTCTSSGSRARPRGT